MNTVEKGNLFENKAYLLLEKAIQNQDLGILANQAKMRKKPKYFSNERKSNITFDLSIEIWTPNAKNYILLYLIECKSYSRKIPVDDVEEFHRKITQVSGINAKAVFITDSTFQVSAFEFAKSNGMMLIQTDQDNYNIILHKTKRDSNSEIKDKLLQSLDNEKLFIEMQMNSLFSNLFTTNEENLNGLDFLSVEDIENITENILNDFDSSILKDFKGIDIDKFISFLNHKYKIDFDLSADIGEDLNKKRILASLDLSANKISLDHTLAYTDRMPFFLMHELGHYFLHKKVKINQRAYDNFKDSVYDFENSKFKLENLKNWLEWQANQFAISLLLPKKSLIIRLIEYQTHIGILRNLGKLYVDDQKVNRADYRNILEHLSKLFGVSYVNLKYRLQSLGLIIDNRAKPRFDWSNIIKD